MKKNASKGIGGYYSYENVLDIYLSNHIEAFRSKKLDFKPNEMNIPLSTESKIDEVIE